MKILTDYHDEIWPCNLTCKHSFYDRLFGLFFCYNPKYTNTNSEKCLFVKLDKE